MKIKQSVGQLKYVTILEKSYSSLTWLDDPDMSFSQKFLKHICQRLSVCLSVSEVTKKSQQTPWILKDVFYFERHLRNTPSHGKTRLFWFLADFRINSTNDNEQIKTTKRNKKYNREVKWYYYRPYFIYIYNNASSINTTNTKSLISKRILHHIYFGQGVFLVLSFFQKGSSEGLGLVKHQAVSV